MRKTGPQKVTTYEPLKSEECELPSFAAQAKLDGTAVLAHWAGIPGWHCTVWKAPPRCVPHWCLEGHFTPGAGPDGFLPMPAEPTKAS